MAKSKAFAAALKKKAKQFKKSRKADPSSFNIPKVDDGNYVARIALNMRMVGNDNKLMAEFRWTIARGAFKGKSHTKQIWLDNENSDKEQDSFDNLSKCLQILDYDMDEYEASDLMDIANEITKEKPLMKIGVKNNTVDDTKYLNSWFTALVDDEDEEEDEDEEAEKEEDEEEETADEENEEEEDEDSEDDEEEEEEEEDYENVEKGNSITYKRQKYKVTSSNQRKETCTLKHKMGKVLKDVKWGEVIIN